MPLLQILKKMKFYNLGHKTFETDFRIFRMRPENASGHVLKSILNKLDLIYLNNDEDTHMVRAHGSTDILDMAFISPNLAIHDIQFQIGVDLGSHHLPIEISIDTTPHRNTSTNPTKYKFDQIDREVFESTLVEALGCADAKRSFLNSEHLITNPIDVCQVARFVV